MFFLFGSFLVALAIADRSLRAARWGALAFFIGGAGILLDALRDPGAEWPRHIALVVHFAAVGLLLQSFTARRDANLPKFSIAAGVVASLWFTPGFVLAPSAETRLVLVQFVALAMIIPVLSLVRQWRDGRAIGTMVFWALALAAMSYFARGVLFLSNPVVGEASDFFASTYNLIFHFTTAVIGFALGLVLLVALGSDAVRRENRESAIDPLTGLGNRRRFNWAISSDEAGKWHCGGVVAIDLDHFKHVNDRFGHGGGDRVLMAVADALKFVFRGQRICRIGGEEFIILLPKEHAGQMASLAARSLAAIESLRFDGPLSQCRISACVGYAIREPDMAIEEAIRRADQAVYAGKAGGRGQVRSADERDAQDDTAIEGKSA
ncbi:GGDEF domain-containing protein [Sphingomicrobium sediminis]|uniref:diguanylate cyclase n=1 Tax=Sphingomicrobium sediminis TaxID=2950949 RepID=A0A9X2J2H8_9SPHN|nr:GGDEF domain-containing protein [Sphingomicrobium sediminis]MCM8556301.1 GGDEF domain-containing protein [Sphingomicrobium sediminis]